MELKTAQHQTNACQSHARSETSSDNTQHAVLNAWADDAVSTGAKKSEEWVPGGYFTDVLSL